MKKLLVLTLVLGIASLASAGLTAAVGDTIAVSTDITVADYDISLVVTSGDLTLDGSAAVYNPATTSWMFAPAIVGGSTPTDLRISASSFGFGAADGELFSNILYTGTGVFDLVENTAAGAVVHGTYTIPEPATMALLGLGALVLRRKK